MASAESDDQGMLITVLETLIQAVQVAYIN